MKYAKVIGHGAYLPKKRLTNDDLAKTIETSDEWIRERTGIAARHIAAEDEYTSDLAAKAASQALQRAGVRAEEVDLILLATATPDKTFPSCATITQQKIGAVNAAAMDLQAACAGFVYALHVADAMVKSGQAKRILVIGAETMSRTVDWEDRSTCILFGDGAGALLLEAHETEQTLESASGNKEAYPSGILYSKIYSDGRYADILATDGGISCSKTAGVLSMQGQEVFRHAVSKMSGSALAALEATGIPAEAVDHVVPHQANHRIILACAKKLGLPLEKMVSTVSEHANTSSASIPLALNQIAEEGKLARGDLLVLPALGAGLTWGSCIIKW